MENPEALFTLLSELLFNQDQRPERFLAKAKEAGLLGSNILGFRFEFHLFIRRGAGAYICG